MCDGVDYWNSICGFCFSAIWALIKRRQRLSWSIWETATNIILLSSAESYGIQRFRRCFEDFLGIAELYYAPCPAEGRATPKAVNGQGRAGCSYFTCTFISTYKVRIFNNISFLIGYCMLLMRVFTMYSWLVTTSYCCKRLSCILTSSGIPKTEATN